MNETLSLTLTTNPEFLFAVGGALFLVIAMFGVSAMSRISRKVEDASELTIRGMHALSRDIQTKDFSFKPKFDEKNGGLKVNGGYGYSSIFPPVYCLD